MREIHGVTAEVKYIHLELLKGLVVFLKGNIEICNNTESDSLLTDKSLLLLESVSRDQYHPEPQSSSWE